MDTRRYYLVGMALIIFLVCTQTPLLSVVFAFFILGMIPGTSLIIPSWMILISYPLIALSVLYWLSTQSLFIGEQVLHIKQTQRRPAAKKVQSKTRTKQIPTKRRPRAAV